MNFPIKSATITLWYLIHFILTNDLLCCIAALSALTSYLRQNAHTENLYLGEELGVKVCRGRILLASQVVLLLDAGQGNMLIEPLQVTLVGLSGDGVGLRGSTMHHLSVSDGHEC